MHTWSIISSVFSFSVSLCTSLISSQRNLKRAQNTHAVLSRISQTVITSGLQLGKAKLLRGFRNLTALIVWWKEARRKEVADILASEIWNNLCSTTLTQELLQNAVMFTSRHLLRVVEKHVELYNAQISHLQLTLIRSVMFFWKIPLTWLCILILFSIQNRPSYFHKILNNMTYGRGGEAERIKHTAVHLQYISPPALHFSYYQQDRGKSKVSMFCDHPD